MLRARTGLLPEAEAWWRPHQGFERGRMGTRPGTDLGAVSSTMLRRLSFMRVYWSGAAIALLADLALRRVSGGRRSLDLALLEFRRRHGPFDRAWDAWELIEALDGVTRSQVFSTLAKRWLSADRFPDLREAHGALSIRVEGTKILHRDGEPDKAELRRQITGRDSGRLSIDWMP